MPSIGIHTPWFYSVDAEKTKGFKLLHTLSCVHAWKHELAFVEFDQPASASSQSQFTFCKLCKRYKSKPPYFYYDPDPESDDQPLSLVALLTLLAL